MESAGAAIEEAASIQHGALADAREAASQSADHRTLRRAGFRRRKRRSGDLARLLLVRQSVPPKREERSLSRNRKPARTLGRRPEASGSGRTESRPERSHARARKSGFGGACR